uniref:PUM-HD domain-containing protein n=1 Tax=Rhabditophanes sp. KR3021 TaxID=114890 RepID=A0AC35TGR9_9BILA
MNYNPEIPFSQMTHLPKGYKFDSVVGGSRFLNAQSVATLVKKTQNAHTCTVLQAYIEFCPKFAQKLVVKLGGKCFKVAESAEGALTLIKAINRLMPHELVLVASNVKLNFFAGLSKNASVTRFLMVIVKRMVAYIEDYEDYEDKSVDKCLAYVEKIAAKCFSIAPKMMATVCGSMVMKDLIRLKNYSFSESKNDLIKKYVAPHIYEFATQHLASSVLVAAVENCDDRALSVIIKAIVTQFGITWERRKSPQMYAILKSSHGLSFLMAVFDRAFKEALRNNLTELALMSLISKQMSVLSSELAIDESSLALLEVNEGIRYIVEIREEELLINRKLSPPQQYKC